MQYIDSVPPTFFLHVTPRPNLKHKEILNPNALGWVSNLLTQTKHLRSISFSLIFRRPHPHQFPNNSATMSGGDGETKFGINIPEELETGGETRKMNVQSGR